MTYSNNGIVSELAPDPVAGGPSYRTHSTIRGYPSVTRRCSLSATWTHPLAAAWVWKDIVIVVGVALRPFPVGSNEKQLAADKIRHGKYKLLLINAELATLDELSTWLTL